MSRDVALQGCVGDRHLQNRADSSVRRSDRRAPPEGEGCEEPAPSSARLKVQKEDTLLEETLWHLEDPAGDCFPGKGRWH